MNTQEVIYSIALSQLKGVNLVNARTLVDKAGSASEVFAHKNKIKEYIPDATERLIQAFSNTDEAMERAEKEIAFIEEKHIKALTLNSEDYPWRLRECEDAPVVFFYNGSANLNSERIINIVGTRKCSEYGRELVTNFVKDLHHYYPDTVVVSGLAYGIDICAHRAAMENHMSTIGVLAHGLDTIYPAAHKKTAENMLKQGGGLLTENLSNTSVDKVNFVRRNRIVAGLCDACIVVESAEKGGALITAELSLSYDRNVFAFPGRVGDKSSVGCNNLIRENGAALLTSAEDFLKAMNWPIPSDNDSSEPEATQQELFTTDFDEETRALLNCLEKADDMCINDIVTETHIPYERASFIIFDLEMKGFISSLGGGRYCLPMKWANKDSAIDLPL